MWRYTGELQGDIIDKAELEWDVEWGRQRIVWTGDIVSVVLHQRTESYMGVNTYNINKFGS